MGQEESRSEEMDLAQIQELCIVFMKECPSGALHLHEFKRIFGVPSSSAEESLYIETIFHSFDTNRVRHGSGLNLFESVYLKWNSLSYSLTEQHAGFLGVCGGASLDLKRQP